MNDLVRHMLATTDVKSMAKEVGEAYRLTVSLERDIIAITEIARIERHRESNLHREIMLGLERKFSERKDTIALVHSVINSWISMGQHDLANSALMHLMKLLASSPTDEAMQQRNASGIRRW